MNARCHLFFQHHTEELVAFAVGGFHNVVLFVNGESAGLFDFGGIVFLVVLVEETGGLEGTAIGL